jgi:hypothetical protein
MSCPFQSLFYGSFTASHERVDETIPERARTDAQRDTQFGYEDCSGSSWCGATAESSRAYELVGATTEERKFKGAMVVVSRLTLVPAWPDATPVTDLVILRLSPNACFYWRILRHMRYP